MIDCIVARAPNDQSLSLTSDHKLDPLGLRPVTPVRSEVFESPHVVDLDLITGAAKLAGISEEPLKKVRSNIPYLGGTVVEDCVSVPKSGSAIDLLTAREREVARLLARGLRNRQIAEVLIVTEKTAANHVQRVLSKLGVSSRAEVAARAAELDLQEHHVTIAPRRG